MSALPRPHSDHPRHRDNSGRILGWLLLGLLAAAVAGTILFQVEKMPDESPVGRGRKLAREAGCFACHGDGDGEARFNLRLANDKWAGKANPTFWENGITESAVLVDWITNGVPADQIARHKKLFIQMPAYKDRLKPDEIDAVAAWILAEGLKFTQTPAAQKEKPSAMASPASNDELFVAGDRLSRRYGCYQCHGELGQGGVANPDSLKGYIPGFFGKDFRALTANGDRGEVLYWIDHGRGQAIESGPLGRVARYYFESQATKMPGYRDQMSAVEKELLADYLLLLDRKGPLSAKDVEKILLQIDHES
jgi:mono/diheme cytochrome c family protein